MSLERFAQWLKDRGSYRHIKRERDQDYLERFFLLKLWGRNAYLHRFWYSDQDFAPHDHPWSNVSIVLKGEYIEWFHDGSSVRRKAGDIVWRDARSLHRIEIEPHMRGKVWTLFLTGKRTRLWGFMMKHGWVEASKVTEISGRDFIMKGWLFPTVEWVHPPEWAKET